MRFIVIGAGSVGGTIGGALAEAGQSVVLVARGAHLDALRSSGLTLISPSRTLRPSARSIGEPREIELTPDDVLILAVKSQDTLPLLVQWSAQPVEGGGTAGERLPLVCAQNGVANEFTALRYFERVYGMCTWLPATLASPGIVVAEAAPGFGILDLGRIGRDAETDRPNVDETARALAESLTAAGFAAHATADVLPWKYGKLLRNLSNAIQAVCGRASSPAAAELRRLVVSEAAAVYRAAGIEHIDLKEAYAQRGDRFTVAEIPGHPRGGGSTWQSLRRGLPTLEVDYLNGEIVALGRLHGVPCPVNERVRQAVNSLAESGAQPGAFSPERLLEWVSHSNPRRITFADKCGC